MTSEQMKRLESIIKNWLNNGAQCNSSLEPYTRSLYPTYNPGTRTRTRRSNKRKTHNSMIEMCEDFLRNNQI
jgi:hypothetical protein